MQLILPREAHETQMLADRTEEARLVRALAAGNHAAFEQVYRRHHKAMVRLAAAILGNEASAEEVTQDAWVAILRSVGSFQGRASLASWMFTIVANGARSRARRDGRSVSFNTDAGGSDGLADAFDGTGHWARTPALWEDLTPERIVAGRSMLDHVNEVIEDLPEAQRTVLTLRTTGELDLREICDLLQIGEGNVRVLLHRARTAIRRRVAELLE